ncbi:ParA family protein [Nocardia sp. 004]|uniref:ParA family protein n=1 Tax=Nocardia sp. 004 TaxID=3385978 RepID=UPI0039A236F3
MLGQKVSYQVDLVTFLATETRAKLAVGCMRIDQVTSLSVTVQGLRGVVHAVRRTILVANRKGGVGKSSIVAAIAVLVAKAGKRVLVIDADPQGNCTQRDLGVRDGDNGKSLAMAIQYGQVLEPVRDVRPGLDVIAGGNLLSLATTIITSSSDHGIDPVANLSTSLTSLVDTEGYDLVLIDSAPGELQLLDVLLEIATWLIVPTKEDEASLDGAEKLAERYLRARKLGAIVELMGMVLFDCDPRATRRNASTFQTVHELLEGTGIAPFKSTIRHDKATSVDARRLHLTPAELATPQRKVEEVSDEDNDEPKKMWSRNPGPLAADHKQLTREVIGRLASGERAKEEA